MKVGWGCLEDCWGPGCLEGASGVSLAFFSVCSFAAAADFSHCFSNAWRSAVSSLVMQHFLYFFPLPQWQGSLRPSSIRGGSSGARDPVFLAAGLPGAFFLSALFFQNMAFLFPLKRQFADVNSGFLQKGPGRGSQ